ncbi:MAG: hypothetical protein ABII88_06805 [Candidatus Omnitrophota bacterium]
MSGASYGLGKIIPRMVSAEKLMKSDNKIIKALGMALAVRPMGSLVGSGVGALTARAIFGKDSNAIVAGMLVGGAIGWKNSGVTGLQQADSNLTTKVTTNRALIDIKLLGLPVGVYGNETTYYSGVEYSKKERFAPFKNTGVNFDDANIRF